MTDNITISKDESRLIEYIYLNMDTKEFKKDQIELIQSVPRGSLIRAIPNYKNNQVLIASSRKHFKEFEAIQLCRKLTGLDRFGQAIDEARKHHE